MPALAVLTVAAERPPRRIETARLCMDCRRGSSPETGMMAAPPLQVAVATCLHCRSADLTWGSGGPVVTPVSRMAMQPWPRGVTDAHV